MQRTQNEVYKFSSGVVGCSGNHAYMCLRPLSSSAPVDFWKPPSSSPDYVIEVNYVRRTRCGQ